MKPYFTNIAKNELKNHFFSHPMDYVFTPFLTTGDFISTFSSIVILPCKFFMLALLSFAEAILSIGYDYFLNNIELQFNEYLAESKSSGNVGLHMMWMFLIAAPVMIVVFVLRFFVTLAVLIVKNPDLNEEELRQERLRSLTDSISRYATLVENSNADLSIINEAFHRCHLELDAFVNTGNHLYHSNENTRQSITMVSYFQVTEEQKVMLREQQCNTELLRACQELMQEYPQNSFLKSTTLEEVESACTLYEEHHAKVLNIAEVILPSLHGMLNEAKRMNASISRVNCV